MLEEVFPGRKGLSITQLVFIIGVIIAVAVILLIAVNFIDKGMVLQID